MDALGREFYERDTVEVARELLGCTVIRLYNGERLAGRITETEAYIGRMDKACHAYDYKRTPRTETLFAPPGTAYLYLIYGMYTCLNFVTEPQGEPAAVLIRGIQPLEGEETMARLRFGCGSAELTPYQKRNFLNGPGKVCKAIRLDRTLNGHDLRREPLWVEKGKTAAGKIYVGKRIGIDYAEEAADFPWRFYLSVT